MEEDVGRQAVDSTEFHFTMTLGRNSTITYILR